MAHANRLSEGFRLYTPKNPLTPKIPRVPSTTIVPATALTTAATMAVMIRGESPSIESLSPLAQYLADMVRVFCNAFNKGLGERSLWDENETGKAGSERDGKRCNDIAWVMDAADNAREGDNEACREGCYS